MCFFVHLSRQVHTSCLLIVWKLARCNALVKGKASTAKELQQLLAVELLVVGAVGTMKAECLCSRCHFGVKGPGCCAGKWLSKCVTVSPVLYPGQDLQPFVVFVLWRSFQQSCTVQRGDSEL